MLVLHAPVGGGHKAAALALAEAGRALGRSVEVIDALAWTPRWFRRAYVDSYVVSTRFARPVYGAVFAASDRPDPARDLLRGIVDRSVSEELVARVLEKDPLAVIATHFFPLFELGRLRREGRLLAPLLAVVTDYGAHALWAAPDVDLYCTAWGGVSQDLVDLGVPRPSIVETGIPVRLELGAAPPWRGPGQGEPLQALITSGGFGIGPVLKVLRSFRGMTDLRLDIVCGDRPSLTRRAGQLVSRYDLPATVTGFATNMPERMARAHVVVGKPGGLTMSECLASGRPLIVVGACPGQETANLSVLESWGAGARARARHVGAFVDALGRSGALASMAAAARAHGTPEAAKAVWAALDTIIATEGRRLRTCTPLLRIDPRPSESGSSERQDASATK